MKLAYFFRVVAIQFQCSFFFLFFFTLRGGHLSTLHIFNGV